jgi:hypothetical protein
VGGLENGFYFRFAVTTSSYEMRGLSGSAGSSANAVSVDGAAPMSNQKRPHHVSLRRNHNETLVPQVVSSEVGIAMLHLGPAASRSPSDASNDADRLDFGMKRMMMPVVSAVSVTQRGLRSCQHKLPKRDAARVVPYKSSLPAKGLWPISCFSEFPASAACSVERIYENE